MWLKCMDKIFEYISLSNDKSFSLCLSIFCMQLFFLIFCNSSSVTNAMPGCMHCDNHPWRMMIYLEMPMQWSKNSPSKQNMQVNGSTNKYMTHDLTCHCLELSIEPQNNAIYFTLLYYVTESSIDFSCYLANSRQHLVTRSSKTLEKTNS